MRLIVKPRNSGKTHALIMQSSITGATIVCFRLDEVARVLDRAREMGVAIPHPITVHTAINGRHQNSRMAQNHLLIDNLDLCLGAIFHQPIDAITLTKEDNE